MSGLDLLILSLACWRVAFLVTHDSVPFGGLRTYLKTLPQGRFFKIRVFIYKWLTCIRCVSVAASILVFLLWFTPLQPLVLIAAISGGALAIHKYTGWDYTEVKS